MTAAARASALVSSQREVARRLGISHTALQKAARSGRIAAEPGGGWDVEAVRAQLTASSDPARGAPSAARATRLAALAEGEAVQDPALAAVVAEVALRARIEAAREGRAPAKRAAASQL